MNLQQILIVLTSLLNVSLIPCSVALNETENCINLQLSISQSVENDGFHRDINWLIESLNPDNENWNKSSCRVSLQLNVPSGMFVNPDQLSELARIGQISAYIKGDVNVETFAHESEEHVVYVFIAEASLEKVAVQLPVHLRYQRAVIGGGFGKVNLPKPTLLVHCLSEGLQVCGGDLPKIQAPCDAVGSWDCAWDNVTYQALFDEVQLFVPIGDLDDYPLVSVVTLLLGCAGSIYILSLLSTTPV